MTSGANPVEAYREASRVRTEPRNEAAIVEEYGPLVRRIAHHVSMRLPQTVELEDVIQAGLIGLIEAARKFDPSHGASFETYAGIRIRGAMIDQVRPCDWAPRSLHRKARELGRAIHAVESRQRREAGDKEVMAELGMEQSDYYQLLRDINLSKVLSIESILPADGGDGVVVGSADHSTPEREHLQAQFRTDLIKAINQLPERDQQVLSMYYDDELNLREIGSVLGVTESRVCQIHAKAMARLRALISEWDKPPEFASNE